MNNKFVQSVVSIGLGKFGILIIGIVVTPLLVRTVTIAEYGIYAFIMSLSTMLVNPLNSGFYKGLRKYVSEDRDITGWQYTVMIYYLKLILVITLLELIIILFIYYLIGVENITDNTGIIHYLLLLPLISSQQVFLYIRNCLMGLNIEWISEPLLVIRKFSFGIIGLSLASVGLGAVGLISGHILATIIIVVTGVSYIILRIDIFSVEYDSEADLPKKSMIQYNISGGVLSLLLLSLYNVDIILLEFFLKSDEVGIYRAALTIAEYIWFVPIVFQTAFIQSTSKLWKKEKIETISDTASKVTRYILLFTSLLVIGVGILSKPFISVYFGEKYIPSQMPLLILLPGTFAFGIIRPLIAIGEGSGKYRTLIIATLIPAIINIALNLILIPLYGLVGAAVSTSIGYASMLFFHIHGSRIIGYNIFRDLRIGKVILTIAISFITIYMCNLAISDSLLSLIIVPPMGALLFLLTSILTGSVSISEINNLINKIR